MEYILAPLLLAIIGLVVVAVVQYRKDLTDCKVRFTNTQPKKNRISNYGGCIT